MMEVDDEGDQDTPEEEITIKEIISKRRSAPPTIFFPPDDFEDQSPCCSKSLVSTATSPRRIDDSEEVEEYDGKAGKMYRKAEWHQVPSIIDVIMKFSEWKDLRNFRLVNKTWKVESDRHFIPINRISWSLSKSTNTAIVDDFTLRGFLEVFTCGGTPFEHLSITLVSMGKEEAENEAEAVSHHLLEMLLPNLKTVRLFIGVAIEALHLLPLINLIGDKLEILTVDEWRVPHMQNPIPQSKRFLPLTNLKSLRTPQIVQPPLLPLTHLMNFTAKIIEQAPGLEEISLCNFPSYIHDATEWERNMKLLGLSFSPLTLSLLIEERNSLQLEDPINQIILDVWRTNIKITSWELNQEFDILQQMALLSVSPHTLKSLKFSIAAEYPFSPYNFEQLGNFEDSFPHLPNLTMVSLYLKAFIPHWFQRKAPNVQMVAFDSFPFELNANHANGVFDKVKTLKFPYSTNTSKDLSGIQVDFDNFINLDAHFPNIKHFDFTDTSLLPPDFLERIAEAKTKNKFCNMTELSVTVKNEIKHGGFNFSSAFESILTMKDLKRLKLFVQFKHVRGCVGDPKYRVHPNARRSARVKCPCISTFNKLSTSLAYEIDQLNSELELTHLSFSYLPKIDLDFFVDKFLKLEELSLVEPADFSVEKLENFRSNRPNLVLQVYRREYNMKFAIEGIYLKSDIYAGNWIT